MNPAPVLGFLSLLKWLDGSRLLDSVETYRQRIFERAFSVGPDGAPNYSLVLCGRGKKNAKTLDLVLAALYSLLARDAVQGSGGFVLANDEGQAGDDLDLAAKLVRCNPVLDGELTIRAKSIERRDGRGELRILPARDVAGAHGKTAAFVGFDEIHEYRNYDLLEALAVDPTRRDCLTWITSYDSLFHTVGRPLWDMFKRGQEGSDPRMLFSWYSGEFTTDPDFAGLPPEQRANPSMASWTNGRYLEEQRLRLPSHKFRRLHLNQGGQPEGCFFSAEQIDACTIKGRRSLPPVDGVRYVGFVDMSGGSQDDAVLGIAHPEDGRVVLDHLESQGSAPPFDPRRAVKKFAATLRRYGVSTVRGDQYAGLTFRLDFEREGIAYLLAGLPKSDIYEELEPVLNAGELELLDIPKLTEQLGGLVFRGAKIDHQSGEHDDWANGAAGAIYFATARREPARDLVFEASVTPSGARGPIPWTGASRGWPASTEDDDDDIGPVSSGLRIPW